MSGCPIDAALPHSYCLKAILHKHGKAIVVIASGIKYCFREMCADYGMSKRGPLLYLARMAGDGAVQTFLVHTTAPRYSGKPCRAMCDTLDDLSSIPDASLLTLEPEDQRPEYRSEIAHHEYLPASRGHDPPAVHHGPAAEDPCNTIMQRYLPLRSPGTTEDGVCISHCWMYMSACTAQVLSQPASLGCAELVALIDRLLSYCWTATCPSTASDFRSV